MKRMYFIGASLMASLAMAQTARPTYSVVDLGPVGGTPGSATFIGNDGLIAGAAIASNNQTHAVVWALGMKLDLATAGFGGYNSFASSVNDRGQAVGSAESTAPSTEDFCGFVANGIEKSSSACLPFLFQNGAMTKLPTLGGQNGTANWINNRGEAVGWAETTSKDPNAACGVTQFLPVIWGKMGVTPLKTFGSDPNGVAASINDRGQVVGATGTCGPYDPNSGLHLVERHAMLWEDGLAINLGNLGGSGQNAGHHACAINQQGQVTGHSDLTGDATFHTFLWTYATGMQDLGTLPGDAASTAISLNDQGTITGTSLDQSFNPRAFVWDNGSMTDLNVVLSSNPQKLYLLLGFSINARGEIVGLAVSSDGNLHGFLATPSSPENSRPAIESTASPVPLSDEARKTIFRRIGVRGR